MMWALALREVCSMRVFPFIRLVVLILLLTLTAIPTGGGGASPGRNSVTERVSVGSAGQEANGRSLSGAMSADGRYVAFDSRADNLVPDDSNGYWDVFVHDRKTGQTERVSVDSPGDEAHGNSGWPAISADGRFVAFWSVASDLIDGDTNGVSDIFVHDRETGSTERVSVGNAYTEADRQSVRPKISEDGRFVAFDSWATNLVPGERVWAGVYVRDRLLGVTERVALGSIEAMSEDGRYVVFGTNADNLVAGDTNGFSDVFIRDRWMGKTELVSVGSLGEQGNEHSFGTAITPDGRYVTFYSNASNLVPADTNDSADGFVRDRLKGRTERVSVGNDGVEGDGRGTPWAITPNGRYVVFTSRATNLVVSDDTNGVYDAFVRDRLRGITERVSLGSDGSQGNGDTGGAGISATGRYVLLWSDASNLVVNDSNGVTDYFVHDRRPASRAVESK